MRIDVGPGGDPWVVQEDHSILRWNGAGFFMRVPGFALDIAIGGDGRPWKTNYVAGAYDQGIFNWNGAAWEQIPGAAQRITSDFRGQASVVSRDGRVWEM